MIHLELLSILAHELAGFATGSPCIDLGPDLNNFRAWRAGWNLNNNRLKDRSRWMDLMLSGYMCRPEWYTVVTTIKRPRAMAMVRVTKIVDPLNLRDINNCVDAI